MASDQLKELLGEYGKVWILEAMNIAVKANKRKLTYIDGILRKWKTEGKKTAGMGRDSPAEEKLRYVIDDIGTGEKRIL